MHVSLYTLVLAEVEATTFRDFNYEKKKVWEISSAFKKEIFFYILKEIKEAHLMKNCICVNHN